MKQRQWIVVGTDFSEGAAGALEQAVMIAARIGADIACVHAYEDLPGTPAGADEISALNAQLTDVIAISRARSKNVDIEPVVRRGPAWEKLLNVAAERGAGLIVVGASGERQGSRRTFLGTVASRLVATSTRMVLVVPLGLDAPRTFEDLTGT